jgi:hypothetical protein
MTDSDNTPAFGSPVIIVRDRHDNLSWQRAGLGSSGRYAGRDYYDRRLTVPAVKLPKPVEPVATGRTLQVLGLLVALAGFAGWLWMVLSFVGAVGAGRMPDDPFGTRVAGVPLGIGGLIAIVLGGLLAVVGSWLARNAISRYYRAGRPF